MSLVAISFCTLLLLYGPCRLSEFTLAGPLQKIAACDSSIIQWGVVVVVGVVGGGVGLCIWKMGGLENRGVEGVPEAGKERAVQL